MGMLKTYLPILISSVISITAIMVLLAMIHPPFFSLVPGVVPPDSLGQHIDTTKIVKANVDSLRSSTNQGIAQPDSATTKREPTATEDSSKRAMLQLGSKGLAQEGIKLPLGDVDSLSATDKKRTVQILESMDAESAAKILRNMDDYAIRQVIGAMKKRQSAKILAVLEPQQAARILKGDANQ